MRTNSLRISTKIFRCLLEKALELLAKGKTNCIHRKTALIVGMFRPDRPKAYDIAFNRLLLLKFLGYDSTVITVGGETIDLADFSHHSSKVILTVGEA